MKTKLLKLSEIVTTAGTQIRASINADAVDQYAEAMQDAGNKFPPVVVFHDGSEYILADGFHRVMAATRNGFKDIDAEIRKGTKSDALKYALGANSTHGIPRTNSDKRRSVELALAEWPKLSTAEIARICAVSRPQVDAVRTQHAESAPSPRIGADGKTYKAPTRKSAPEPAQPETQEPTEPPRVTIDTQWKAALGKKGEPAELTPTQEARQDLFYLLDKVVEDFSKPDLKELLDDLHTWIQRQS